MPRPHALPRRKPTPADAEDPFPPFRPVPPVRVLSSVNLRRDDKAIFDALQSWLSFHEGRSLHQWEVCARLLQAALENRESRLLAGFRLPLPPSD